MDLLILKNGRVFARSTDETATDEDVFVLSFDTVPEYPEEDAGKGKEWYLDYDNGALVWLKLDRPLTQEERLEKVERELEEQKYAWKPNEQVNIGDRRFYNDEWYICLQLHTTQELWTPNVTPALWEIEQ